MQVRRIDTERETDVHQFVTFPFKLYQDCPQWVPPLISDAKRTLDRHQHPYYRHSSADFFLAEEGGRILGRVAVLHNRNHNEYRGVKVAFFSLFEVVEDIEIARALFHAVFDWAAVRDLDEIIGPMGFIGPDACGVLVEGFEYRPAMGVAYNYSYYDSFITELGFVKDTDHLSGYFRGDTHLPSRIIKIAEKVKKRRGFWIKTFESKDEMRQWVPRVAKVHRQSFINNFEYFPPTLEEITMFAESLISIADPRLIKLVMKDDEVIGFIIAYHDISAGLQKAKGKLWPLGWYYILRERKRTRWANVNGAGLIPVYQGLGANTVLYVELTKTIHEFCFEHVEVVQADERNFRSISDVETVGVKWYKRHRNYRRAL